MQTCTRDYVTCLDAVVVFVGFAFCYYLLRLLAVLFILVFRWQRREIRAQGAQPNFTWPFCTEQSCILGLLACVCRFMFLSSTLVGIVIIFVVAVFVSKIFDVVIHQLCVAGLSLSQDPMVYAWCRLPGLPGSGYLLLDLVSLGRDVPGFMPTSELSPVLSHFWCVGCICSYTCSCAHMCVSAAQCSEVFARLDGG